MAVPGFLFIALPASDTSDRLRLRCEKSRKMKVQVEGGSGRPNQVAAEGCLILLLKEGHS
jgi:hypothetical protein